MSPDRQLDGSRSALEGASWTNRFRAAAERLDRIIDVSLMPGGARGLLIGKPRSIAAMRLTGSLVGRGLHFSTIIDVGANVGQFSRAALAHWPRAEIIAFEPLPSCAHRLDRSLTLTGRVELHKVALGQEDGVITFYPHEYSLSSSALPATEATQREYGWARERPSIEVPVRRLDSLLAGRSLGRPALLKLDVQGFELEVLAGATRTLRSVDAVLVEVAFEAAYEGQPLFSEVHDHLVGEGWALKGPLDARRERGRIVELDCLYQPVAPPRAMHGADDGKLVSVEGGRRSSATTKVPNMGGTAPPGRRNQ